VADGVSIKLEEETNYPFAQTVNLKLSIPKSVAFPLYLRVPRWCAKPAVKVNEQPVMVTAEPLSFIVLDRTWADGDRVTLELPMPITVKIWKKNNHAASVERGPLAYALAIPFKSVRYGGKPGWPELELYPTGAWNYGLVLDAANPADSIKVGPTAGTLDDQPFTPQTAPVHLLVTARKIPAWKQDSLGMPGKLQPGPIQSDQPNEMLTLVPMGAARLRISCFPIISTGNDGHPWIASIPASALHFNSSDSVDALSEAGEPASSGADSARFTWRDHKGAREWVLVPWCQLTGDWLP
jgi:hypothetical protein